MVTIIALVLLAPVLLINLFFVAEVAFGLATLTQRQWPARSGRTVVILPAHNEERVIGRTLSALKARPATDFDILVVADNCSDETAAIARGLRRHRGRASDDPIARQGLCAGLRPRSTPRRSAGGRHRPRCRLPHRPGSLLRSPAPASSSARPPRRCQPARAVTSRRPAGAGFLLCLPGQEPRPAARPSAPGGKRSPDRHRHVPAVGAVRRADLATASIVEDVRLGIELARGGAHPRLIEEAIVWSPHADQSQTLGQRSRWEGGFLALARATAPGLIGKGLSTLSPRTLLAGLDLMVPPLALLALLNILALAAPRSWPWSVWCRGFPSCRSARSALSPPSPCCSPGGGRDEPSSAPRL
jgi:hypothetical protein